MSPSLNVQIGQLVKIRRGRDTGMVSVIVQVNNDGFVYIADGKKRKISQPKKKNIVHLEPQAMISREVLNSMKEMGSVTNGELRFAIREFLQSTIVETEEKGDGL